VDSLLFCDLAGEAKETVKEITKMKKDIESWKANNEFALKLEIKNFNDKTLGPLRKISYNIRADLNTFIYKFVEYDGILITMQLLDECKRKENWDILHVCCKILEEVLKY
jgi:hypothetical protein